VREIAVKREERVRRDRDGKIDCMRDNCEMVRE
jgi:hypothetical protein